jgi:hypothetical protein
MVSDSASDSSVAEALVAEALVAEASVAEASIIVELALVFRDPIPQGPSEGISGLKTTRVTMALPAIM